MKPALAVCSIASTIGLWIALWSHMAIVAALLFVVDVLLNVIAKQGR